MSTSIKIRKLIRKLILESDVFNFDTNQSLSIDFWNSKNNKLDPEISLTLLDIAYDFMKESGQSDIELKDIIFTGSLANYNYSKYSDIDLHIVVEFKDVDENLDLVKEYFDFKKNLWNLKHDIVISGYDVEIYVQDASEPHVSSGVYSIMHNKWIEEPVYTEPNIDYGTIKKKAGSLSREVDRISDLFSDGKFRDAIKNARLLRKKLSKFRKAGLEREGEYSVENLAFKSLRRSGDLEKLSNLKSDAYDKMMSIE